MKKWVVILAVVAAFVLAAVVAVQFMGSSERSSPSTAAAVSDVRLGTYVVLTGNIVARQRSNYFTFQDSTGTARVEISPQLWRGQTVAPETQVTLEGEVSRDARGRYVWVETLDTSS